MQSMFLNWFQYSSFVKGGNEQKIIAIYKRTTVDNSASSLSYFLFTDDELAYSGDFGSGVGWEDEEEKGAEETAEEAEEEEGEVGEVDDGGYIW